MFINLFGSICLKAMTGIIFGKSSSLLSLTTAITKYDYALTQEEAIECAHHQDASLHQALQFSISNLSKATFDHEYLI